MSRRPAPRPPRGRTRSAGRGACPGAALPVAELAEDVGKDPAVAEVLRLHRRVDPHAGLQLLVARLDRHVAGKLAVVERLGEALDRDLLVALEVDRLDLQR